MKVRKISYKKENNLTASIMMLLVGTPRLIPHEDYTFPVVRNTIARIEKISDKRYEYYDIDNGTVIRRTI